jgi:hypothetical protein
MRRPLTSCLLALFLLGACSGNEDNVGPGGLSAEDAAALDEAAAKLDREASSTEMEQSE